MVIICLNQIEIQIKHNKNKLLVMIFEPLATVVMMLLVLILPYYIATKKIIYKTKNVLWLNASLGTTPKGYLLVVTSFVYLPLFHLIMDSYPFHYPIRYFWKLVKFSPCNTLLKMSAMLSWISTILICTCVTTPTLLLNN